VNVADDVGMTADERETVVDMLAINPTLGDPTLGDLMVGDLMVGAGGARKFRVAGRGKGKSGGYRAISYFGGGDIRPCQVSKGPSMTAKPRMTKAGRKIVAGLEEARAYMRAEHVPGLLVHKPVDVKAVRQKTGLSQGKFAEKFGLDVGALRAWEQETRTPDRAARLYLRVIDAEPEAVERALKRA
jgi:putative transcriptional regulator